jgi:hypothetical protein
MKLIAPLIAALACLIAAPASAQWHWIDNHGRAVFSDRPPPPDIPDKNVRRQPGLKTRPAETNGAPPSTAAGGTAPPAAAASAPQLSGVEPALLEKKKQAEKQAAEAEAAQRRLEADRQAQLRADSCARARQAQAGLDAGLRIARTNAQGEREFLDEAARAQEAQRIQAIIDADCR